MANEAFQECQEVNACVFNVKTQPSLVNACVFTASQCVYDMKILANLDVFTLCVGCVFLCFLKNKYSKTECVY